MKTRVAEETLVNASYIIAMNNNAVSLMMDGSRRKAARILFEALKLTKNMQQFKRAHTAKARLMRNNIASKSSNPSDQSSGQSIHDDDSESIIETVDLSRMVPSEANNFALFNHAFIFNDELSEDEIFPLLMNFPGLLTIVILYNTALCHHQEGIVRGNSSSFANALHTYKILASIIVKAKMKSAERRVLLLPMLALWNNMGHIHSNFFSIKESQKCVKCIRKLLAVASRSDFYQDELKLFRQYVVIPPELFFATAPAA